MVDIRPKDLPPALLPLRTGDAVIIDQGAEGVRQTNPISFTDSVAPVATQSDAQSGTDNTKRMTPLRTKQSIASEVGVTIASSSQGAKADTAVQSVNGKTGNSVTLVKGDVGLGNVDNTSDANKPVSTATQAALDLKANSSITISAGAGLTGGGTLAANRNIALNSASIASLAKADSSVQTVNGIAPTGGNVSVSAEEVRLQDSRSSAILESFPGSVNFVQTAGYSTAGDGGGAMYKRVATEPSHAGKVQSADGGWWEITETELDVRMFGAVADDTENSAPAINDALQAASMTGRSSVLVRGGGTFLCNGVINVPSYVQLIGDQKTIIKQADGSTLNSFINLASRSKLLRCVVDGNASNYAGPSQSVLVRIGDSHFVDVVGNNIGNAPDYCVAVNAGTYAKVQDNTLHDFKDHAVAVYGSNQSAYHTLTDNYIYNIGWAGFIIGNVSHCLVARNRIIGALMGGRLERMTVNSSGTTVTRVSGGSSFENLRPGQFVVMNNGMEFRIQSITSSNTLETETPVPTLTGVQASCGTGDMIGVIASQFVTVEENIVVNCATFGMGASLGGNASQCSNNVFRNNVIQNAGKNGINIAYDGGTGYLANNRIEGNRIINPGYAGGIGATDRIAIMISSTTAGKTLNNYVGENTIVSFAGEGQVRHWLGCDAQIGAGQVKVGTVTLDSTPLSIFNAVESVTLTPAWGSGAAVSSIDYDLNHTTFNVTVGSGPTSDPMVTVMRRVVPANMKGDGFLAKIISTAGGGSMTAVLAQEYSDYAGHQRATLMMTPTVGNVFRIRFLI